LCRCPMPFEVVEMDDLIEKRKVVNLQRRLALPS